MCVVIDANTFHKIVQGDNSDFIPLNDWIRNYDHKVIHGGSTYKQELSNNGDFLRYLKGLERIGKTHELNLTKVDILEKQFKKDFIKHKYDDHHIVAILFISGCNLVCSNDKGFHELIKDCCSDIGKQKIARRTPLQQVHKIRIYQNKKHKKLLYDGLVHCWSEPLKLDT